MTLRISLRRISRIQRHVNLPGLQRADDRRNAQSLTSDEQGDWIIPLADSVKNRPRNSVGRAVEVGISEALRCRLDGKMIVSRAGVLFEAIEERSFERASRKCREACG